MEGPRLQCGDAFANERAAAVDQAGLFGAIVEGRAWDGLVVGFVGLAKVGSIGVRDGALLLHPVQGGRSVQPAGEGDADFLPGGQRFENYGHAWENLSLSSS